MFALRDTSDVMNLLHLLEHCTKHDDAKESRIGIGRDVHIILGPNFLGA